MKTLFFALILVLVSVIGSLGRADFSVNYGNVLGSPGRIKLSITGPTAQSLVGVLSKSGKPVVSSPDRVVYHGKVECFGMQSAEGYSYSCVFVVIDQTRNSHRATVKDQLALSVTAQLVGSGSSVNQYGGSSYAGQFACEGIRNSSTFNFTCLFAH